MDKTKFQDLSNHDRGEILFKQGEYIAAREYYNHRINLYSLYDFFVEAWYFPPDNKITDIKVIIDDKGLDPYIDNRLKFNVE